ncbi:MAG: glycosyltransferase family 39 protein [Spirulinaceae cyanobacterium]
MPAASNPSSPPWRKIWHPIGQSRWRHWLLLGSILTAGLGLRLWRLASKPLWVDEVITSIFGLGRNFDELPADQVLPLTALPDLFTLRADVSCGAIASHLATQSTHPPLFFCLLHRWLIALGPGVESLAWALRSFAVLWGVAAIAALYLLNRLAFSPQAGLVGAGVMALSPFAVYLSQEARHYTLPITLITLGLAAQVKLHQQLQRGNAWYWLWALWGCCHLVALYSHYFCLLAIAAQGLMLIAFTLRFKVRLPLGGLIAYSLPLLGFIPWLPTFWQHFNSPKTGWLAAPTGINPLVQTLAGWIVMVISLPVERQPLVIQIGSGILTLVGMVFLIRLTRAGFQRLPLSPERFTLVGFLGITVLEFFAVIYVLQKDISIAPRYHFVYFPAVCALLGAAWAEILPGPMSRDGWAMPTLHNSPEQLDSLSDLPTLTIQNTVGAGFKPAPTPRFLRSAFRILTEVIDWVERRKCPSQLQPGFILAVLILSISSLCVVYNLAFPKPYAPALVAAKFNAEPAPVTVMMAYHNTLEMAVGLSYGLALAQIRPDAPGNFAMVRFTDKEDGIWQTLAGLAIVPCTVPEAIAPQYLWVIAPGYFDDSFPSPVQLAGERICTLEPEQFYRLGFPYQRYRCE